MVYFKELGTAEQGCSCPIKSEIRGRATARALAKLSSEDGSSQCRNSQ
jgi:hypothetical protein